jgi:uncharacterized protein YqeY
MPIKDQVVADLKKAMLDKNELARDTLRMVKADLMNREVELGRDLDEAEATEVLVRGVKSRKDSIAEYEKGGRPESAAKERSEIEIIERYLPKQLTEEELKSAIAALAGELGLSKKKDMGALMKELKTRHGAAADMRLASKLAGEILTG